MSICRAALCGPTHFRRPISPWKSRAYNDAIDFHMLVALEYAFLASDTVAIGMVLIRNILNSLKRV
jgi:hypothetical protein